MEDDTILIEENEVLTLPSERVNSHHLPNIFKKREHISNKIVDDQKLQPFKEALGDYQVKRANSPIKTPSTGREYDPLFTELNDLMETNPRQLNFDTEAADTLRLVDKKSEDSQQDSGNRLKLNKEGSSSKINYDSDHDSDGSRYSYSRLASIATGLQHKKSDHWKRAKRALGALQFGKEIAVSQQEKHENIMQGSKNLLHKSRTIFLSKNSPIATIWNFLIFLTIIHYDVLVPYLFACSIYSFEFAIIEIVFDIFILLDIGFKLITFPSIRKHSNFKEHILRPYLKKFALIDFISLIPLYFVDARFLLLKILRNFHLPRCFHAIRKFVFKIGGTGAYPFLYAAKMWLTLVLAIHLLTCIWMYIGLRGSEYPTWIEAYNINHPVLNDPNDRITQYINSFFFLITTASTVGFGGDYLAFNTLEMMVCMFFIFAGLVLIGFFQGKVQYMIENNLERKSLAAEINDDLERWLLMKEKLMMKNAGHVDQMGQTLMNQIMNYFKFFNANNVQLKTSASEFFERTAPDIKDRIIDKSLHGIIAKFHIFFDNIEELSCQKEIILHLKPKYFMPFQKIVSRGHHPAGIYFILNGYVVVYTKGGEAIVLLGQNGYFGDSILVEKKARYDIWYQSSILLTLSSGHEEVKCLFISRRKFLDICSRYPATTLNFVDIAKKRISFEKEAFRNMVEALKGNLKILLKPFNEISPSIVNTHLELPSLNLDQTPKINKESCNYLSIVETVKHEIPKERSRKFLSFVKNPRQSSQKKLRFSEVMELQEKVESDLKKRPMGTRLDIGTVVDLQKLKFYSQKLDGSDYSYSETEDEEAVSIGDENDEGSVNSQSDDDEKLNNSLEVPFQHLEIQEEEEEEKEKDLPEYINYFEEKINSLNCRIDRIKKELRHETMGGWKLLKTKKKKNDGDRSSVVSLNTQQSINLK